MNTETLMDEVVKLAGGGRVDSLLPLKVLERQKNADYVFQSDYVIAELKSLQREIFTWECVQKLNVLLQSWSARHLIRGVYGRVQVSFRQLPVLCQQELFQLLAAPLQNHVIAAANRQIRETKDTLGMPDAKGVLILANDGADLDPYNLIAFVTGILKKRHPDGSLQYSSIDGASFFSLTKLVSAPASPTPMFFWFNGLRDQANKDLGDFLDRLEASLYKYLSQRLGVEVPRIQMSHEEVEKLKYS